jgi:hypothetical protein
MLNKKAFGELSDAGLLPIRESPECEKHLVLLRFNAGGFRRIVATPTKLTDAIAVQPVPRIQNREFSFPYFHCIVLRYKCKPTLP